MRPRIKYGLKETPEGVRLCWPNQYDGLTAAEHDELEAHGPLEWLAVGSDGSVWAVFADGLGVAQVRGRKGRRLVGARPAKGPKTITTSVNLYPEQREKLTRLAADEERATGRRVTLSQVVQRLVDRAEVPA